MQCAVIRAQGVLSVLCALCKVHFMFYIVHRSHALCNIYYVLCNCSDFLMVFLLFNEHFVSRNVKFARLQFAVEL